MHQELVQKLQIKSRLIQGKYQDGLVHIGYRRPDKLTLAGKNVRHHALTVLRMLKNHPVPHQRGKLILLQNAAAPALDKTGAAAGLLLTAGRIRQYIIVTGQRLNDQTFWHLFSLLKEWDLFWQNPTV
ncbi:hypothetical protein D3C71_1557900 [compost metagenome]